MKSVFVLQSAVVLLFAAVNSALAASFDCSKAATATERAICQDGTLSTLDEKLAASYQKRKSDSGTDNVQLIMHQREWMTSRNQCGGDVQCLRNAYQWRSAQLVTPQNSQEETDFRVLSQKHGPRSKPAVEVAPDRPVPAVIAQPRPQPRENSGGVSPQIAALINSLPGEMNQRIAVNQAAPDQYRYESSRIEHLAQSKRIECENGVPIMRQLLLEMYWGSDQQLINFRRQQINDLIESKRRYGCFR